PRTSSSGSSPTTNRSCPDRHAGSWASLRARSVPTGPGADSLLELGRRVAPLLAARDELAGVQALEHELRCGSDLVGFVALSERSGGVEQPGHLTQELD